MTQELCRVETADGVTLDGCLWRPDSPSPAPGAVDAFLLVHGTGSNFYARGVLETFAGQASVAGWPVLRVNTRGHDAMAFLGGSRGSRRGGAAFEAIGDCVHDLRAWLDWLAACGVSRIALVGHSMGGVKAIYATAYDPHPAVACVVGVSPPRFCFERLSSHTRGAPFRDAYETASRLVDEGRPDELIEVEQPLPLILTAGGFLAKYGPHDDYDVIRHLARIDRPVLVLVGTVSVATSPAFDGLPEAVRSLAATRSNITLDVIEGANTVYGTCPNVPFERTADWLRSRI